MNDHFSQKKYILIGSGGHAKVVSEAVHSHANSEIAGYLAPERSKSIEKLVAKYLGSDEQLSFALQENDGAGLLFGIGAVNRRTLSTRRKIFEKIGAQNWASISHIKSTLLGGVRIGHGCFVAANATIGVDSQIGDFGIVNTSATIDHDCKIGTNCHVAVGATICGGVIIGSDCLIGANATILQGVKIGNNCIIGANTLIDSDVPCNSTIYGARSLFE